MSYVVPGDVSMSGRARQLLEDLFDTGGAPSCGILVELLRGRLLQPISALARWIASRQVVHIACGSEMLVPIFQIDIERAQVRPGVASTIAELSVMFDDLQIAEWFVTPNLWLGNACPLTLIDTAASDVLGAARADRCMAGR